MKYKGKECRYTFRNIFVQIDTSKTSTDGWVYYIHIWDNILNQSIITNGDEIGIKGFRNLIKKPIMIDKPCTDDYIRPVVQDGAMLSATLQRLAEEDYVYNKLIEDYQQASLE